MTRIVRPITLVLAQEHDTCKLGLNCPFWSNFGRQGIRADNTKAFELKA
jgi:hypothetical protein